MCKKFACLLVLILVSACLFAQESGGAPMNKDVGYALLDAVGQTFHEMAVSGTGGVEKVTGAVLKLMADARKARDQNQIDAVFFARYRRILAIIKLAVAPDPQGILVPMLNEEFARFVYGVLGEEYKVSGPEAIGQVANAIADELINLHLYLDNIETKEKLRQAWDEKMSGHTNKEE
jgi:hypothetical protein